VREWQANFPERFHDGQLRTKYGITREEYLERLARQGGACAICREPETVIRRGKPVLLAVDHDHATGRVRALLCSSCNRGIGMFKEQPQLLRAAVAYLDAHA
jgi:hypothetical protein